MSIHPIINRSHLPLLKKRRYYAMLPEIKSHVRETLGFLLDLLAAAAAVESTAAVLADIETAIACLAREV